MSNPVDFKSHPSEKEMAAAKAARIRLGLEEDDGSLPVCTAECVLPTIMLFAQNAGG